MELKPIREYSIYEESIKKLEDGDMKKKCIYLKEVYSLSTHCLELFAYIIKMSEKEPSKKKIIEMAKTTQFQELDDEIYMISKINAIYGTTPKHEEAQEDEEAEEISPKAKKHKQKHENEESEEEERASKKAEKKAKLKAKKEDEEDEEEKEKDTKKNTKKTSKPTKVKEADEEEEEEEEEKKEKTNKKKKKHHEDEETVEEEDTKNKKPVKRKINKKEDEENEEEEEEEDKHTKPKKTQKNKAADEDTEDSKKKHKKTSPANEEEDITGSDKKKKHHRKNKDKENTEEEEKPKHKKEVKKHNESDSDEELQKEKHKHKHKHKHHDSDEESQETCTDINVMVNGLYGLYLINQLKKNYVLEKCITQFNKTLDIEIIEFSEYSTSGKNPSMVIYSVNKKGTEFTIYYPKTRELIKKLSAAKNKAFPQLIAEDLDISALMLLFSKHITVKKDISLDPCYCLIKKALKNNTTACYNKKEMIVSSAMPYISDQNRILSTPTQLLYGAVLTPIRGKPLADQPVAQKIEMPSTKIEMPSTKIEMLPAKIEMLPAKIVDPPIENAYISPPIFAQKSPIFRINAPDRMPKPEIPAIIPKDISNDDIPSNKKKSSFTGKLLRIEEEVDIHMVVVNDGLADYGIHYGTENEVWQYVESYIKQNMPPREIPCPDKNCKLKISFPLVNQYFREYCNNYQPPH